MKAVGLVLENRNVKGPFKVSMFFQNAIQGNYILENLDEMPSNHPTYGLFEFEPNDQFCRWIDPNK